MESIDLKPIPASIQPSDFGGATLSVTQGADGRVALSLDFASSSSSITPTQAYDITAANSSVTVNLVGARISRLASRSCELVAPEINVVWRSLPTPASVFLQFVLTDLSNDNGQPKSQCDFSLNGTPWSLVPKPDGIVWATLSATGVTRGQISDLERDAERVVWLLAFANGALLVVPTILRVEIRDSTSALVEARLRSAADPSADTAAWQLVPIRIPKEVTSYIEWSYPRLLLNETAYLLPRLMHWLILATKQSQPLHLRALIAAEVLEILRFNFAKNVFRAPQKGDQFDWPPGSPSAGTRMSFREILKGLVWALGSSHWNEKFVGFRNSIIHQGEILGATFSDQISNTNDTIHFGHTVVLSLLEWDRSGGVYFPYNSRPSKATSFKR